eukprot:gene8983-10604_t
MTKDIRAFFFGGKPAPPKPAPAPVADVDKKPKAVRKSASEDDDVFMVDSDDEDQKPAQRKRLKTTKQASVVESSPVGKKRAADVVDIMDSPTPSKSLRSSKSPIAQKATVSSPQLELVHKSPLPVVKEEKPLLAVFAANAVASPTKKVREIKGGAAAFFGGGAAPAVEETKPVMKEVKPEPNRGATVAATPAKRVLPSSLQLESNTPVDSKAARMESPPSRKAPATSASKAKASAAAADTASSSSSNLCFEGQKIAVTGVMASCSREDLEDLILQHGGKLSAAVSGKTSFLLAGLLLEDGREAKDSSKYKAAVEKKIPIWSEEQFMGKIAAHQTKLQAETEAAAVKNESQASAYSQQSGVTTQATASSTSSGSASGYGAYKSSFATSSSSSTSSARAPGATSSYGQSSSSSSSSSSAPTVGGYPLADMLWVDKYKPQSSAGMIGSTELVNKLTRWLQKWDAVHLHHTEKIPFTKENPGARAVLLSGPP